MKVTSECFEALAMSGVIDNLQVSELQEYTKENKENVEEIMVEMESIEYSGAAKLPQVMMSALIVSMPNNVLGLIKLEGPGCSGFEKKTTTFQE